MPQQTRHSMYRVFASVLSGLKLPIIFYEYESPNTARAAAVIKYHVRTNDNKLFLVTCRLVAIDVQDITKEKQGD